MCRFLRQVWPNPFSSRASMSILGRILSLLAACAVRSEWSILRGKLLTTLVTEVIPKTILPSIHLEIAYFGWRMNNFCQACKRLDLHPQQISLEDAAAVVARLKYPEPRIAPSKRRCQIQHRKVHLMR